MGVKDLWKYLSPVCEKKSLWELQSQTVAIDLSCWICDSQGQYTPVLRPYMRNLFFRTSCLLMLGIRPIFVLEGEAPIIKQREIKRRINANCEGNVSKGRVRRSRLNGIIQQCKKLLEVLGVQSLGSPGEAEAMCAYLNDALVVDACITQDSDSFLYGARVVYRNFTAGCGSKSAGFAVDSYDMNRIQRLLCLDREALVALALLCGCDYQDVSDDGARGVAGIGMETATILIIGLSKICDSVLSRLKSWRVDRHFNKLEEEALAVNSGPTCIQCGHRGNLGQHDRVGCKGCNDKEGCKVNCSLLSENSLLSMAKGERKLLLLELKVRAKAVAYPGFPSQTIIDEFLSSAPSPIQLKQSDITWNQPHLSSFLEITENYLGWSQEYSLSKFLPLLARWKVMQGDNAYKTLHPNDIQPVSIKKRRVSKGVPCFEVEWNLTPAVLETSQFSTLEPVLLFEKAYPSLSQEFLNKETRGNRKPRSGADKKTARKKPTRVCSCSGNIKAGHICQFFKPNQLTKNKAEDESSNDIKSITKLMKNVSVEDLESSSSAGEHLSDIDDDFDPLELSAIINCIVDGNCGPSHDIGGIVGKQESKKSSEFQLDTLKTSTLHLSEELSEGSSRYEINSAVNLISTRDYSSLKKDVIRIEMKDEQFEIINLESSVTEGASEEGNVYKLQSEISQVKDQILEPNFDLGASILLQTPKTSSISKSINEQST